MRSLSPQKGQFTLALQSVLKNPPFWWAQSALYLREDLRAFTTLFSAAFSCFNLRFSFRLNCGCFLSFLLMTSPLFIGTTDNHTAFSELVAAIDEQFQ